MPTDARPESDELADPRPIERGDGARAVLLIHGLTGTPYDVAPFAEVLHAEGFAVRAPLLAGHSDLSALEHTSWRDWYETVETAFDALHDSGRRQVLVLGFSAGSLLCLRLAALRSPDVSGLAALSVPLELLPWQRTGILAMARLRTTPGLGRLVGRLPKKGPDVRIERVFRQSPSLRGFPYPTLAEFIGLQDEVAALLPHVRAPLLLMHGRHDHTAPVTYADRVAQRVASARVEQVVLPRSFHIIAHDLDRERACAEVLRFTVSVLRGSEPAEPSA